MRKRHRVDFLWNFSCGASRDTLRMIVADGKKLAADIFEKLRGEIASRKQKPELIAVLVGRHPASVSYLNEKRKACEKSGIDFTLYQYNEEITTTQLRRKLAEVRRKKKRASCIVQLPLPAHINAQYILNTVPPECDPDMLSAKSLGSLVVGKSRILPPTPAAPEKPYARFPRRRIRESP